LPAQVDVDLTAVQTREIRNYVGWVIAGLFLWAIYSEFYYRREATPQRALAEGQDVDVAITLVSTDAKALSCASSEEIKGRHCEWATKSERWNKPSSTGRPAATDTLAPYKTTDDILLLVPGLFSEPALVERLAIDPPTFGQEHIRFVANCKLHVEAKLKEVDVRWATQGQWYPQREVPMGTVTGCWLSDG
jgi:hypothetical protein